MKLSLSILLAGLLSVAFTADNPQIAWGTKTIYVPLQSTYAEPPGGYAPVFINYVGRHGARFQTSITADSILFQTLALAAGENGLTPAGIKLKRMDSLLINLEKNHISLITDRGKEEQEAVGQRMAQHFKGLFSAKNGIVRISTTKKERTRQSARAFLEGLNLDSTWQIITNTNDNDELAFYDSSPGYQNFKETGNWKSAFNRILEQPEIKHLYEKIPDYFIKESFIHRMSDAPVSQTTESNDFIYNKRNLSIAVYEASSIIASLDHEIAKEGYQPEEFNISSLLTNEDLQEFTYISGAEDFLVKGPGTDVEGIQVRIAAPLLISFLNATEEYIKTKKITANLRFGHAETIAPFAAILGINGASESIPADKIQDYQKSWDCSSIIPLSANIQWILYKNNAKEEFMVRILLNEKEVTIHDLKVAGSSCYYNWSDVKEYYTHKLEKMNIHLQDNIHEYLTRVK